MTAMGVGTFMRRAMALATATAAWVLLIQVTSTAMAPPVIVELSPVDVSRGVVEETLELTLAPTNPALIVVPGGTVSATPTTTQEFPLVTVASSTTTTTAPAPTTTTTRAATTTTTAAPVTTTTASPAATTTTTAPPATTTSVAPPVSGTFSAAAESEFISKINGLRSSVGVAGLAANGELNNYARWWAQQMADSGNFSHSDIGSLLDPWSVVGENIGYGPTVTSVFDALVNSSGHYNNMVDARFTSVGVGAYIDSAGRIWTAHVFGG
ncbi:MAG: CAP domain-containing protein [Acidimicrobiia bacterium]